jgi:hypothetical protein
MIFEDFPVYFSFSSSPDVFFFSGKLDGRKEKAEFND